YTDGVNARKDIPIPTSIASAHRVLTAASEDPGSFQLDTWTTDQTFAFTVAVEPAAAGGGATTVSRTASDSFTFADSLSRNGLFIRSPADAFTFTDAIA